MKALDDFFARRRLARLEKAAALRRALVEQAAAARRLAICTIATADFLPWALALFDSLARHHPGAQRVLLYVRGPDEEYRVPRIEGVHVIGIDTLVTRDYEGDMRMRYGAAELCFALKPLLLRHCLDRHGERAIYLDSDIDVVGPLTEAMVALEAASLAITPHLDAPIPIDGLAPSSMTILRAGSFNAGFIGVAEGAETRAILDWWYQHVLRWGYLLPELAYQGDQKWLDAVVTLFPGTHILRDPGSNLGTWNLHSRRIARDAAGALRVNGAPLAFVHFSGFDPMNPEVISRYQNRHDPRDHPELVALARDFASRVLAAVERADALAWEGDEKPLRVETTGTARPDMLPEGGYRARIEGRRRVKGIVATGEALVIDAKVTNDSPHRWNVARNEKFQGGIALSWHLLTARGERRPEQHYRYWLPHDLGPGESFQTPVTFRLMVPPGIWQVELDLVHEGFTWFGDKDSPTLTFEVYVDAIPPTGD